MLVHQSDREMYYSTVKCISWSQFNKNYHDLRMFVWSLYVKHKIPAIRNY